MSKYPFTKQGFKKRISTLMKARNKVAASDISKLHVKLQPGNSKTGRTCYTVSLLPTIDCGNNCHICQYNCYDLKADMRFKDAIVDRSKNSVIHEKDPKRYWDEISTQVKANYVELFRLNVGGDLTDDDFMYVAKLGRQNKRTDILFFTKNYEGINNYLEHHRFPANVHPIMSCWEGLKMENPYHLPESHLLYDDGRTTAPEYGAYFCGGNCTECHFNEEGCWSLKKNEHVIFHAH